MSPSLQRLIASTTRPLFTFSSTAFSRDPQVISLRGREEVNRTFRFEIEIGVEGSAHPSLPASTHTPSAVSGDLLGAPSCLTLLGVGGDRAVRGIVSEARFHGYRPATDLGIYRVRLVPKLWLLGRARNTRIFQDKTADEVIDAVLKPYAVSHRWSLSGRLSKRGYCVQHQETDLAFVQRLLAEEGVFYFIEHGPAEGAGPEFDGGRVTFADSASGYLPIAGSHTIPFRESDMLADEEHVSMFAASRRIRTGATLMREFDFKRPALNLRAEAKSTEKAACDETSLRRYDHHNEYEDDEVGASRAQRQLDQLRARAIYADGEGTVRRFVPGSTFTLDEHGTNEVNAEYVVTRIDHDGRTSLAGESIAVYRNRFRCIPAERVCRPRLAPRRQQQSLETATVVGPKGEEIYTDRFGRIKVQFHWDNDGAHDEHSSCWLRVSHAWAGAGWGFQFIPRVGMEVLVLFEKGDTDRPIVVGSAYNGRQLPPFPLPAQKTQSGIRTRSTPDSSGYNELSFEDKKGDERVYLRAERDLAELVQRDRSAQINRDLSLDVRRNEKETIGANSTRLVGANQVVTIGANLVLAVGATCNETIGGDASERVGGKKKEHVGGDGGRVVHGAQSNFTSKGRTDFVGDAFKITVGKDAEEIIGGVARTVVKKDAFHQVVGHCRMQVDCKGDPGKGLPGASLKVGGDVTLAASEKTLLRSDKGLRLECGPNSIELKPDGIYLRGKIFSFIGEEKGEIKVKGAAIKLDGDTKIIGGDVSVSSSGASVKLDSKASISGASVALGSGSGDKSKIDEVKAKVETVPIKVRIADSNGAAISGKSYRLTVEGMSLSGTTDGSGHVEQKVPKTAEQGELEVSGVDSVEGGIFRLTLMFGGLAPINEVKGVQARLSNLGYKCPHSGELDDDTRLALRLFQTDQELKVTGDIDGPTRRKLQSLCG